MLNQQAALDATFQALADPTRRAMIERLSRKPTSVSELAQPFNMSLPAVMQHLAVLEGSGLVVSEKIGRVRTCRIEAHGFSALAEWVAERRNAAARKLDRLGAILDEADPSTNATQPRGKADPQ